MRSHHAWSFVAITLLFGISVSSFCWLSVMRSINASALSVAYHPYHHARKTTTLLQNDASTIVDGPLVFAVGDIAGCDSNGDEQTAALLSHYTGPILVPGDIAYNFGTAKEFRDCYDPAWGKFKDRTYPVPGNHEYALGAASGYFSYFGKRAGDPKRGWYSFNLGSWHIIALNSNCSRVGGCNASSAQVEWLNNDLAQHPAKCTLAFFHHPVFSSGMHGDASALLPIWRTLVEHGVELVLSGHDHDYERFAPMDENGSVRKNGTRQFVVGTGGKSLYPIISALPTSEERDVNDYGVLALRLGADAYSAQFILDSGAPYSAGVREQCH